MQISHLLFHFGHTGRVGGYRLYSRPFSILVQWRRKMGARPNGQYLAEEFELAISWQLESSLCM